MPDIREAIIARLVEIAISLRDDGPFKYVDRNIASLDDDADVFPALVILDGDEDAEESDPLRSRRGVPEVRRIRMSPFVHIASGAKPEEIGTDLNTLRALVIKTILNDSELLALTINGLGARYDGLVTPKAESGRLILSQRILRFTFSYLLRADKL